MSAALVIVQARDTSTRFPRKIHQVIGTDTMIEHVLKRVRRTGLPAVLAHAADFPQIGEADVLGRFVAVLERLPGADPIIRITADCPLLDGDLLQRTLAAWQADAGAPMVGTGPAWDGLDVEVFGREALLTVASSRRLASAEREHVGLWFRRRGACRLMPDPPAPLRWSVDTPEDLDFVRRVVAACALCAEGVPHHTNAAGSISGTDRQPRWDLHQTEDGGLAECTAHAVRMTRVGGPVYDPVR